MSIALVGSCLAAVFNSLFILFMVFVLSQESLCLALEIIVWLGLGIGVWGFFIGELFLKNSVGCLKVANRGSFLVLLDFFLVLG
jgi:hypothetical protein